MPTFYTLLFLFTFSNCLYALLIYVFFYIHFHLCIFSIFSTICFHIHFLLPPYFPLPSLTHVHTFYIHLFLCIFSTFSLLSSTFSYSRAYFLHSLISLPLISRNFEIFHYSPLFHSLFFSSLVYSHFLERSLTC